ncbi:hypothetical protein FXO37_12630 [Capsicum annuum]|nr:hypothetical protein FXO37_12630 [Capsicum annuum]
MESNMTHTEKVIKEKEGWGRCLVAESQAIDALTFINLKRDWIGYNTIHHVEKKDIDKKQDDTEGVQTGDVKYAIEKIKEADPENGNKSLNMEDIKVDSEQTVSETLYASDDFSEHLTAIVVRRGGYSGGSLTASQWPFNLHSSCEFNSLMGN